MVRILALVFFALAAPALAQEGAPSVQRLDGPVVRGVCLLSREAVYANAKIGIALADRLQQLTLEAQAEIDAERRQFDLDMQAFLKAAPQLSEKQHRAKEQEMSDRFAVIEADAQQRWREIDDFRLTTLERVANEAQPVIAHVYRKRHCGLLVDRTLVLGGNLENDLTAAVVEELDAHFSNYASGPGVQQPPVAALTRER